MTTPLPYPPTSLFVLVGSGNPSKIAAVRLAFSSLYPSLPPSLLRVEGVTVESGVNAQPFDDQETYQGALTRATNALEKWREVKAKARGESEAARPVEAEPKAGNCNHGVEDLRGREEEGSYDEPDFVVGLEGGVKEEHSTTTLPSSLPPSLHCFAWMVILEPCTSKMSAAKTASFPLPLPIAALVREGVELGEADDRVFGRTGSKEGEGIVGLLTGGVVDRANYYSQAIVLAMIPFLKHRELYWMMRQGYLSSAEGGVSVG